MEVLFLENKSILQTEIQTWRARRFHVLSSTHTHTNNSIYERKDVMALPLFRGPAVRSGATIGSPQKAEVLHLRSPPDYFVCAQCSQLSRSMQSIRDFASICSSLSMSPSLSNNGDACVRRVRDATSSRTRVDHRGCPLGPPSYCGRRRYAGRSIVIVVVRACSADIFCFLFCTECRISREQQLVRLLLGLGFVFDVRLPSGSVQKLGKTIYRIEGVTKLEIRVRLT